jgi:hypothetical protein
MSTMRYRCDPSAYEQAPGTALEYLKKGLEGVKLGEDFSRDLQKNSDRLMASEEPLRGPVMATRAGFGHI